MSITQAGREPPVPDPLLSYQAVLDISPRSVAKYSDVAALRFIVK